MKNLPTESLTSPNPTNNKDAHEIESHPKLTKDALETHNELSNQQKRFRSSSSSSISSTSSTTSSSSTLSPRSKKMKRWMRRRPCPQVCERIHYFKFGFFLSQSKSYLKTFLRQFFVQFSSCFEKSPIECRMNGHEIMKTGTNLSFVLEICFSIIIVHRFHHNHPLSRQCQRYHLHCSPTQMPSNHPSSQHAWTPQNQRLSKIFFPYQIKTNTLMTDFMTAIYKMRPAMKRLQSNRIRYVQLFLFIEFIFYASSRNSKIKQKRNETK